MNGRLAKAIRKMVRFHPAADRWYRAVHRRYNGICETGTFVAEGSRRHYQKFKAGVLNHKRAAA